MAKKTKELTLEEKLEQALVPREEWSYEVPENWCWCKVGSITTIHRGVSYKKNEAHSEKLERDILVLRGGNIKEGNISIMEEDNVYVDASLVADNQIIKKDDIVIVASTGSAKVIGKAGISYANYKDVAFGAFLILVRPIQMINSRYVDYFFQSAIYRSRVRQLASGVNINNIRSEYITETPCPLPPIAEQQRIVDRIESLFAKLDEVKEIAEEIVNSFELRKSAILHKAFTGELTAKWRQSHGVGMENWEQSPLSKVCDLKSGTTLDLSEELEEGLIPYIKVSDMNIPQNASNIITSSRFVNSCPTSHGIPFGSTIFPKRGGAILTNKKRFVSVECIVADLNIMALIPKTNYLNPYYCYYWMLSVDLRELNNGSNVPQINNKDMVKLFIPTPNLEEQARIVDILIDYLDKEQQAKEAAESVLDQIDTIKKAILARAFRGGLGTNNKEDIPAEEILRDILKK